MRQLIFPSKTRRCSHSPADLLDPVLGDGLGALQLTGSSLLLLPALPDKRRHDAANQQHREQHPRQHHDGVVLGVQQDGLSWEGGDGGGEIQGMVVMMMVMGHGKVMT